MKSSSDSVLGVFEVFRPSDLYKFRLLKFERQQNNSGKEDTLLTL